MSELTAHLIVDAGHPAVRIEVLDAEYRLRASGYGRIEQELPTGFYTIQYKAADARQERLIALRSEEPLVIDEPPDLPFSSAAPLENTSTSHEYHQHNANRLSRETPLELGSGSQLFVFVRDLDLGGRTHPAKGLSLHTLSGETVVRFDEVMEASRSRSEARWGGRNLAVDPGFYRLRLTLRGEKAVEMILPACPDWQSQVFLLRQGGEGQYAGKTILDLANAAQLMARPSQGFDPWNMYSVQKRIHPMEAGEDLRLVELARRALAMGYRGVRTNDLRDMLWGKWEDPLLGILGLHLILQQTEPDLNLAEDVLGRLRGQILSGFRHPDIDALALEISWRRGAPIELPPIEVPPMLRQSWNYLIKASAERPGLIPPTSLAYQISDRLWGASAWLIWQAPIEEPVARGEVSWLESIAPSSLFQSQSGILEMDDRVIIGGVTLMKRGETQETYRGRKGELESAEFEPERSFSPGGEELGEEFQTETSVDLSDFTSLRQAIEGLLEEWQDFLADMGIDKFVRKAKLTEAEYALLVKFQGQLSAQHRSFATQRDPLSLESLVRQLGLPAELVQEAMSSLYVKLLAVLPQAKGK